MGEQREPIFYSDLESAEALKDTHIFPIEQDDSGGIRRQKKLTFQGLRNWLDSIYDFLGLTAYKDRVKTKVLWTGPLSVVSTPTILDGGESFDDWDLIQFDVVLVSDTVLSNPSTSVTSFGKDGIGTGALSFFNGTDRLIINKVSNTSFQIITKQMALANVSRIIGISL
jgi:hypothetical protein